MTAALFLSYWTGLRFVAPDLDFPTLAGTAIVMHVCDAVMCWLVAHNNGYPKGLWTVLGLVAGLWAVTILMLLPRRDGAPTAPARLP